MKKILGLVLAIIMCTTLAACGQKAPEASSSSSVSQAESVSELRIISGAPGTTEILVGLGLGDNLVAIDQYSKDIEGVPAGIPELDLYYPDAETIISLKPDLVLSSSINSLGGDDPFKIIKEAGINVLAFSEAQTIEGVKKDIMGIAEATNSTEKAAELIAQMDADIAQTKEKAAKVTEKKSVYFEIAPAPNIYDGGAGTFHNEMVELLGAKNIFADQKGWFSPSEEAIITANPDVIITNVNYTENSVAEIKGRKGWNSISAIKNDKVFLVPTNITSRPSHNITKGLLELAKVIYPEEFK